jgi:hypothetical protein
VTGVFQKKNTWRLDRDDYFTVPQPEVRIDRRDPAWGHRHLITVAQLRAFLDLLPDWDELAVGLRAFVLDSADDCTGWHDRGVVAVCAWEQELWWTEAYPAFVKEHRALFDLLTIECEQRGEYVEVPWTEEQARAFQLLHILTRELGDHHDRMTTHSRRDSARGEDNAERLAHRVVEVVWPAYAAAFGV